MIGNYAGNELPYDRNCVAVERGAGAGKYGTAGK